MYLIFLMFLRYLYISDTPVVPGNVYRVTSVGYLVFLVCLLLGVPDVPDVLMFFKYLL